RNDISFGLPGDRVQSLFRIQPVVPLQLDPEWNLIFRTIVPFVSQPVGTSDRDSGLGDIEIQMFVSPKNPAAVIWGVRPVLYLATAPAAALAYDMVALGAHGAGPCDAWPVDARRARHLPRIGPRQPSPSDHQPARCSVHRELQPSRGLGHRDRTRHPLGLLEV